jgi:RNA recognition motif-containing protein
LSADGDEKAIRALFSRYGVVREVLMKNGYAFVEFEDACSADTAMRDLNGSDILGHPMIVEPSHQQRLSSRRKPPCGRVEVLSIPPPMTLQQIEQLLLQFGPVLKMEIEEGDFGMKKIVATFETQESAQMFCSDK